MKPALQRGQLKTWKDDRGFGFITPDKGGKEVFLHISALRGAGRRPRVGDTILYELVAEPGGKIRAANASIQGVAPRTSATKRTYTKKSFLETLLRALLRTMVGIAVLSAGALFTAPFRPSRHPSPIASVTQPECVIKGNISIDTGNRLYHLPGMEDYEITVINPANGERWFCSESEAIENGWRRAPR